MSPAGAMATASSHAHFSGQDNKAATSRFKKDSQGGVSGLTAGHGAGQRRSHGG